MFSSVQDSYNSQYSVFDSLHGVKAPRTLEFIPKSEDIDFDIDAHPDLEYEDFCQDTLELAMSVHDYHRPPCAKRLKLESDNGMYTSVPVRSPSAEAEEDDVNRKSPPPVVLPITTFQKYMNMSNGPTPGFTLVVGQQPSHSVVYKRIVKPFPAVMLLEDNPFANTAKLFVDCVLIREDNGKVADILEGNQPLPISNGAYTVFKKLKIKETSRVHKTKFRLKFRLVQSKNKTYVPINTISVMSDTLCVYSHSSYVSKSKSVGPPVITDILPSTVSREGGTRCVIIGSNFIKSKHLRVKLGTIEIEPTFHESGTLIFTTPPLSLSCKVSVTNDSINYSQSETWVTLEE